MDGFLRTVCSLALGICYRAIWVVFILALAPIQAALASCDLTAGVSGNVVEVIDGDTIRLAGGLEVRLVGMQAPKLPLGRPNFPPWPLGDEAKAALSNLVLNERVTLYHGGETMDRHGRTLAHAFVGNDDSGLWVQGDMIGRGLARTYSFKDNRECVRELQALEQAARNDQRGIWNDPFYPVLAALPPAALLEFVDTFQLIEGRIVSVQAVNRRVYLNFGQNWRDDFTGSISARDARRFSGAGLDLASLEGKIVRIRGWIEERGGPMITVTHPEQIEIVATGSTGN